MKELSIEEKAKAYDDILVKLQKAKTDDNVCDDRYCCVIDIIVPELKELEDERIRGAIIDHLKDNNLTEWAVWLENQGEQKPAWSEKDEEYFDDIVRTLRSFVITGGSEAKRYTEEEINWLKSLRPKNRWKPSDEQMVALKHAFNDGSIDFADMKILATLYEQLKALHRY